MISLVTNASGLSRFALLATGLLLGVAVGRAQVRIEPGPDWIPLTPALEVQAGSALDFSGITGIVGSCAEQGRVLATPDGHFALSKAPERPVRFYGVNLCFSANYLSHAESDTLTDRLVRLGYNTVRIHHHDGGLTAPGSADGLALSDAAWDQLDYLVAACGKRGLYVTTDGYVSRKVPASVVWPGAEGTLDMADFKTLAQYDERAYANLAAFIRAFLEHRNPYTGMRYADDPAIGWFCLVNEGLSTDRLKNRRDGDARVLAAVEAAWGAPLTPVAKTPALADFLAERERRLYDRLETLVREEIGSKVLLTNMNGINHLIAHHRVKARMDYVDAHLYVDHPGWAEKPWRLPSTLRNENAMDMWHAGGTPTTFLRIAGKPFTVTEMNYAAPNQDRGMGGLLAGAMAGAQDWDGIWRFAYSHHRAHLFEPAPMDFFNLARDPLNQATERALLTLYLRGDMPVATSTITVNVDPEAARQHPTIGRAPHPSWHRLALSHRVAIDLGPHQPGMLTLDDLASDTPPAAPASSPLVVDPANHRLTVTTAATVGGFAKAGTGFTAGPLHAEFGGADATLWLSSLDGASLPQGRRLLLSHLTDLQNTGTTYRDASRTVLEAWGELPYLVRAGTATVTLAHDHAAKLRVYALALDGSRAHPIRSTVENGHLKFQVSVDDAGQARMLYEIIQTD